MLQEEFYPPLSTMSVPNNMGAIRVSSDDISEWVSHQQQQKGARMLMIAAMLKGFASPGRKLQNAFTKVVMSQARLENNKLESNNTTIPGSQ